MWNFEYTLPNENECEGKAQGLYQITSIDNFMCYGHVMCVIDHPQAWTLDDFRCFISWIRGWELKEKNYLLSIWAI